MFKVEVKTKNGTKVSSFAWNEEFCHIGRSKTNDIVLHGWRVSGDHAVLQNCFGKAYVNASQDSKVIIVNKKKIPNYGPLEEKDLVQVGDYHLTIVPLVTSTADRSQATIPVDKVKDLEVLNEINTSSGSRPISTDESARAQDIHSRSLKRKYLETEWRTRIHGQLFHLMDLRRINISEMDDVELRAFTDTTIKEILSTLDDFPQELDPSRIGKEVLAEAVGLGPLEDLLEKDSVSEVMVNAHDEIFYEENGRLMKSEVTFTDDKSVISAIERIVAPLGRRIDESSPMVDARLKDGSRVNAVIPPLALKGPSITIRKFMKNRLMANDLIKFATADSKMMDFLENAILRKRNVVISGGTGSGKTTLLNVLSNFIPGDERIVTVEDAAELKLHQSNLVSLEARPANQEGTGAVTIRELVKNCLRMRPDRIVVGECRGGEALDMLQAMNTGHDGSLTTVHSNSPRDCISRLEVLTLMSGMNLPVQAIREQISSAVNIIVQQTRFSCGSRRITSVTEVTGVEGETVQLSEIFKFRQTGYDENGKVLGNFEPTGLVPEFYEDLRKRGIEVDMSIFRTQGDF